MRTLWPMFILAFAGCESLFGGFREASDLGGDLGADLSRPDLSRPDLLSASWTTVVDDRRVRDLDILFLIDNSPSMSPKQKALALAIPQFIQTIDATGADYHVGIATSDVGSYTAPGTPWSMSLGSCNTFEGDDGVSAARGVQYPHRRDQRGAGRVQHLVPGPELRARGRHRLHLARSTA